MACIVHLREGTPVERLRGLGGARPRDGRPERTGTTPGRLRVLALRPPGRNGQRPLAALAAGDHLSRRSGLRAHLSRPARILRPHADPQRRLASRLRRRYAILRPCAVAPAPPAHRTGRATARSAGSGGHARALSHVGLERPGGAAGHPTRGARPSPPGLGVDGIGLTRHTRHRTHPALGGVHAGGALARCTRECRVERFGAQARSGAVIGRTWEAVRAASAIP
jgi:hypothetical protein